MQRYIKGTQFNRLLHYTYSKLLDKPKLLLFIRLFDIYGNEII